MALHDDHSDNITLRSESNEGRRGSQAKGQQHGRSASELQAVSIWSKELKGERLVFLKLFGRMLGLTTLFMWATLPIYWGAYYRQEENLQRLGVAIVDLDTPAAALRSVTPTVGPAMVAAVQASSMEEFHLGWEVIDTTQFDLSGGVGGTARGVDPHAWAERAVENDDYFGVIVVNANATIAPLVSFTNINLSQPTTKYSGEGAVTIYYAEARNFDTVDQWVGPGMTALVQKALPDAAARLAVQLLPRLAALSDGELAVIDKTAMAGVISMPFGSSVYNLLPLSAFAGIPATSIGLVYLLVFTFFVTTFWNAARGPVEHKIGLKDLLLLKLVVPVVQYLFISLSISLVSLAFSVPFANHYGKVGFFLFWMSNWLAQTGLGMMMELSMTLVGPQFTPFFLIFWIIINVSVAFLDMADQANFYAYGFGLPVFNAVDAAKSITFGTTNHLGQNFGVEIGWVIFGFISLSGATVWKRKRELRTKASKTQ